MDGHVDGIVVLVREFDHLLQLAVGCRHPDQPREATHAVVDVDHEVAGFELHEFLEGQRHLGVACVVGLEVVLVETVEYLVVGQPALAQGVVHKSLVQGALHGLEGRALSGLLENVLKAFGLLRTVGQYI